MIVNNSYIISNYLDAINISLLLVSSVKKVLNKYLKTQQLTFMNWVVLETIYFNKANTPTKVAERVGIDISTLSRLLDQMDERKLIVKEPYELDGRVCILKLTKLGNQHVISGLKVLNKLPDSFKTTLTDSERSKVTRVENLYFNADYVKKAVNE